MTDTLEQAGVRIFHHFGGGTYAKETLIPAGRELIQHSHPHDHLSILARGSVIVTVGDVPRGYDAPDCIHIKAGYKHSVRALTDAVWYCIHATEDTDPATVDTSILTK